MSRLAVENILFLTHKNKKKNAAMVSFSFLLLPLLNLLLSHKTLPLILCPNFTSVCGFTGMETGNSCFCCLFSTFSFSINDSGWGSLGCCSRAGGDVAVELLGTASEPFPLSAGAAKQHNKLCKQTNDCSSRLAWQDAQCACLLGSSCVSPQLFYP